jgi:hypothetical protein
MIAASMLPSGAGPSAESGSLLQTRVPSSTTRLAGILKKFGAPGRI